MRSRFALVASYAPSLIVFREQLIRDALVRGHQVLCVAPDVTPEIEDRLKSIGAETAPIALARTGLNPFADKKTIDALTELFRSWKPDIVMGYTPKPAIYASIAAGRAGVPRIVPMVTGLGYAFLPGGGLKRRAVRAIATQLYRRAFAAATGAIFHNRDDLALITHLMPPALPATVVNGSGVDLTAFPARPLPPVNAGITFLMVARLVRFKGVGEFVEAARIVKAAAPRARFVLIGPEERGPGAYPAREFAKHADAVTWLGPSNDVRPHLESAHVFVLPSYGEGLPRTVLEALATGRPVITTNTPGCRETVQEGVNGHLVPPQNAQALADAMLALLKRPDRITRMAVESRKLAEQLFDVRLVNHVMLDALGLS